MLLLLILIRGITAGLVTQSLEVQRLTCKMEDDSSDFTTWDPIKTHYTLKKIEHSLDQLKTVKPRASRSHLLGKELAKAANLIAKPIRQRTKQLDQRLHEVHSNLIDTIVRQFSNTLHDPAEFKFSLENWPDYDLQQNRNWTKFNTEFASLKVLSNEMKRLSGHRAFKQLISTAKILAQNLAKLTKFIRESQG